MIEYLTLEDVLALIDDLQVGPIRDVGLLDSAVHRPQVTVFGADAYPEIDQKAAVLLESLVRNHALIDGNKRIGWLATVVFYGLNNITSKPPTTTPTTWSSPSPAAPPPTRRQPHSSRTGTSRQQA